MKTNNYNIILCCILALSAFCAVGQGVINNGAYIVLSFGPYIYINGASGNYMNQDASGPSYGRITVNTSGTIDINGNWTNNSADNTNKVFTTNAGTVELIGAAQSINGTATTYFNNLNLLGSGTKTLNVNTLVGGGYGSPTGVLAVGSRVLDLNLYTLTMSNPLAAGITYGAGYILSETNVSVNPSIIKWKMNTNTGAHVYPFGVAGVQIPFTFNKTTAGAADVSVSTRATATSDNTPWAGISDGGTVAAVSNMLSYWGGSAIASVIDRWWDIYASAATTADVTFTYRGIENTMTTNPTGAIQAQHWNGSMWNFPVGAGTGVTTGTGTCFMSGVSTFSPWILVSANAPLPIELFSFKAECHNHEVEINWTTSSEINNAYFTVQRSLDGTAFEDVTVLNGKGNSNMMVSYSYIDNNPYTGNSYYRLQQTDFNNKSTYSNIVANICNNEGFAIVNIYPDVENHTATLAFNTEAEGNYHLTIFDVLGNKISSKDLHANKGFNKMNLDFSSYSQALYFMVLSNDSKTITHKFIY